MTHPNKDDVVIRQKYGNPSAVFLLGTKGDDDFVALEHVEGALDAQRAILRSELATLKSLLEQ